MRALARPAGALRLLALLLSPLALAPACGGDLDSVVVVQLQGPTTLPAVFRLRATLSNAGTPDSKLFPGVAPSAPIAFPTAFSLTLPHARAGDLDVAIDALGERGDVVANGAARVPIKRGDHAEITVALAAGAPLCGNGNVDAGEDCDDGDRVSNGTCDFRCQKRGDSVDASSGCSLDLLANGAFDAGEAGWTVGSTINPRMIYMAGDPALGGFAPSSAPYLALLGRNLTTGEETLSQAIHIPAAARTLTMQGMVHTAVTSCPSCNAGALEIVQGSAITPVKSWTGQDGGAGWQPFTATLDAVALRDATATFRLRVAASGGSISPFFFDSLTLKPDPCGP